MRGALELLWSSEEGQRARREALLLLFAHLERIVARMTGGRDAVGGGDQPRSASGSRLTTTTEASLVDPPRARADIIADIRSRGRCALVAMVNAVCLIGGAVPAPPPRAAVERRALHTASQLAGAAVALVPALVP